MERLAEKALNLARAQDGEFVLGTQFVHAENRDDVLEIAVTLQHFLDAARDGVMLFADNVGRERFRSRRERIDGGIDAELRDRAFEHDRRIEVGESIRRRRIGQIVRRDVDGLDGRDRAFFGGGDAFLEIAHLRRECRLITDSRRRASEQRRHFRACLRETKDVVDKQ